MEDKGEHTVCELRLYITCDSGRSVSAVRNLARIYREYPHESYSFEIVDLLDNPRRAQEDNIIAIPTLMMKDQKGAKKAYRGPVKHWQSCQMARPLP